MRQFSFSRRRVLGGMAALSATAAAGLPALGQGARIAAQQLADGVSLVTGAGCNILVAQGPDGLVLVDTGAAETAPALAAFLDANFPGAPVARIINTHWRPANTGGNDLFGAAGAPILAHKNTQLWMGADFTVDWEGVTYAPRAPEARPTETTYEGGELALGDVTLAYGHVLQAYTDGDLYVWLPEANVLMAGGIAQPGGRYPIIDTGTAGWIGGMLDGLQVLIGLSDERTRVIGASGPLLTKADMQAQYDMLLAMKAKMLELMMEGMGPDDMLAAGATAAYDAAWGDPALFVRQGYEGMLYHLRELGGIIA